MYVVANIRLLFFRRNSEMKDSVHLVDSLIVLCVKIVKAFSPSMVFREVDADAGKLKINRLKKDP